tara:strand:+ start:578 stop:778 length:201 start_codon:yes stop_codon:yes gene_type:complete
LIKEEDLPNIFQLTLAQESNSNQVEALTEIVQAQEIQLNLIKETLQIQHEVLELLVTRGKNENSRD